MATVNLRDNNLYANGRIVLFEGGEAELVRDVYVPENTGDDLLHTVRSDDRLDKIAYKYYSKVINDASKYWFLIADVNGIENPLDISEYVGTDIVIPNLNRYRLTLG